MSSGKGWLWTQARTFSPEQQEITLVETFVFTPPKYATVVSGHVTKAMAPRFPLHNQLTFRPSPLREKDLRQLFSVILSEVEIYVYILITH